MKSSTKRVSFYPDTTKNKEFLDELNVILKREGSSIAECSIQKAVSDSFCVFISPKNAKHSFTTITFNFVHPFDREGGDDGFYAYYEKEGLDKIDIELLNNLFKKFTFDNYYEGLFFASKFFLDKKVPLNFYLKFSENESQNKHIIQGHKVARFYSNLDQEQLDYMMKNASMKDGLLKCNPYGFKTFSKIEDAKANKNVYGESMPGERFLIEHVKDYETMASYMMNLWKIVEGELVQKDISEMMSK